jgi:two-component system sensor histidine kinase ChiS
VESPKERSSPAALDLSARIADLESDLAAAQRTIDVLLDHVDGPARALVELEAQLRQKNAELERQASAKSEFISIVAHELRTPLTSIVGYLELLGEGRFGELPGTLSRPLSSMRRNADRLKRLVDEMLDVSRIERGRFELVTDSVDLRQVAAEVVNELLPLATAKRQTLTLRDGAAQRLGGDQDKLHRVLVNLVANAIRYTPEAGQISVNVESAPATEYPGDWIRLVVRDNGVGLTEAQRLRIFEPFTTRGTTKHHTSIEPGSSGLGLHIARGLVELHGGLITVDSDPGVFTEFTVLLPRVR